MVSDNQKKFMDKESTLGPDNYNPLPVVLSEAKGVWVWDVDQNKSLDMMSAYSAVSHGHAHPELVKVFHDQSDTLELTSRAFYTHTLGPSLATRPRMSGFEMALPMNSGAEAVETAIKAARRWAYRSKIIEPNKAEIIVANGNFHGRTTTIVSFSSDSSYKDGFGPFTPGFKTADYCGSCNCESIENCLSIESFEKKN